MTQDVPCYFCGSIHHASYLEENGFPLVKCQRCGLLYVTPRPVARELPAATLLGLGDADRRGSRRFDSARVASLTATVDELFSTSGPSGMLPSTVTWLDLGCGHGELLSAVGNVFGDRVVLSGLEPDMNKAAEARRRGFDVTYFDPAGHGARYDVVSAFDLFTRQPNPRVGLGEWTELLNPGGLFILRTSATADLPSFDHPRPLGLPTTLSVPTADIVTSILADIGLRVEQILHRPIIDWNRALVAREMVNAVVPGRRSRLADRAITSEPLSIIVSARRI